MRPSIAHHLSHDSARDPEPVERAVLSPLGNPQRMFHIRFRFPRDSGLESGVLLKALKIAKREVQSGKHFSRVNNPFGLRCVRRGSISDKGYVLRDKVYLIPYHLSL